MRPTSDTWDANRLEDVAAPGVFEGRLEVYEPITETEPETFEFSLDSHGVAQNIVDASWEQSFDYTRATVPFDSSTVKIENGPNRVDFGTSESARFLTYPGTIEFSTGYDFTTSFEVVSACRHQFVAGELSDDDLYVTLKAQSFASALDGSLFLKGRYDPAGIPASTLFEEILSDVDFVERGWWNYVLGDEACVASTTLAMWSDTGFDYWSIDPTFDDILVYLPIPPVSHRDALTMLAAYVGAYVFGSRDGSIVITPALIESET